MKICNNNVYVHYHIIGYSYKDTRRLTYLLVSKYGMCDLKQLLHLHSK